jgi:hypothetical protein
MKTYIFADMAGNRRNNQTKINVREYQRAKLRIKRAAKMENL